MITATLRAACLHAIKSPRTAVARFWSALRSIVTFLRSDAASPHYDARMTICRQCSIYDSVWKTCGDGRRTLANGEYVGCLCYMPFKAKMPNATCWLHDQGVSDEGWKPEL